ncbi:makorin, ring finger protein, 4 [Platichthys flesus]|uniref:makorin, ring finger protein, 4 n=1 Tax=Platichthys flesus TaxID=8260 RepID=UPI002DB9AD8D|nr:makorin, ring finger protein, 4 [Platichthys flesus]
MEGAAAGRAGTTRRMDSGRSGSICRSFLIGSCRFGPRCHYRHEWPVIPSAQICRHFQKGGCWYGDCCRFIHILQPVADAAVAGRRSSAPTVSSSHVAHAQPDRRRSEPALLRAEVTSRQECSRSEQPFNISDPRRNTGRLPINITVEQAQDIHSLTASRASVQRSDAAEAGPWDGGNEQRTSSTDTTEEGATAAAFASQGEVEEGGSFLNSKNMTCGICMDKVYEKTELNEQLFGILPNCNHSFCLPCIRTWRKTKDFGQDVVKSCPQCRVRSAFYVPSKYWVDGKEKENVIAAFKEKCRQKSCSYFARYRCCPFKAECLYRHDKPLRRRSFQYPTEDKDDFVGLALLDLFMDMALGVEDDDDNDDDFEAYYTLFPPRMEYGF